MRYKKIVVLSLIVPLLALAASINWSTAAAAGPGQKRVQVIEPLNIAILIQDDLVRSVGNEMGVTAEFIRSLPVGSRVMVGYITTGTLQVRQPFTTDTDKAAHALRIPRASDSASPYNPYIEVIEGLRLFDKSWQGSNVVLLVSDGLDVSRGFDSTSAGRTMDLERAIKEANLRDVAVYSFYAPSVGLTSHSRLAASYGQSSLNRLANDTGGQAFFQGMTGFVTFDPYFDRLRAALNNQYARAN